MLHLTARLHFFAGSAAVRFVLTLHNPRKAAHPDGLWDLGNGGSVYLRDAALTVALPPGNEPASIRYSPEIAAPFTAADAPLELYQDSSGGENWRSHNHLNRKHVVPHAFRGYRLRQGPPTPPSLPRGEGGVGVAGATPAVGLTRGGRTLGMAMEYFLAELSEGVGSDGRRPDSAPVSAPVGRRPRTPGRGTKDP